MINRYGWHIISEDRELRYSDGRKIRVGSRMKWKDTYAIGFPKLCYGGMHASPRPEDAFDCFPRDLAWNGWLCRVLVEGTNYSSRSRGGYEAKFVGTHRTVLGMVRFGWARPPAGTDFRPTKKILEEMRKRNRKNGVKIKVR